jgi:hypothetical protein
MLIGNMIKVLCEVKNNYNGREIIFKCIQNISVSMWGRVVPGRVLKGVGINISVLRVCQLNGWLFVFVGEILITTSPAKFGNNLEKM